MCDGNSAAAQALLSLTRPYDRSITPEKAIALDINTINSLYELPVMLVLCTGMHFIWENRVNRRKTSLYQIREELEQKEKNMTKDQQQNGKFSH
jgi:hypothetical protein